MRSEEAMFKETEETRDIMPPDDTVFETEQTLARNVTSSDPAVAAPIVKPLIVMINADAGINTPEVVNMTAVAEVVPNVAVKPATLLALGATKGITEDAKKFVG